MPLSSDGRPGSPGLRAELEAWLEEFAACVRDRRYERARALFSDDVVAFGTHVRRVVGQGELEARQWRVIWEASSEFHFDLEQLDFFGDERLAIAALPWTSVGYDARHVAFQRPGRATIALARRGDQLLAVHTHFSLDPKVPEATFARTR